MKKEIVVAVVVFVCLVGVIVFVEVGKRRKPEAGPAPDPTTAGAPPAAVSPSTPAGIPDLPIEGTPAGTAAAPACQDVGGACPIAPPASAAGTGPATDLQPAVEHAPGDPPPAAGRLEAAVPASVPESYVVQPKDTLSGIADRVLGSHKFTALITKKNPNVHPDRLIPGAKLAMPGRDELLAFARSQKSPVATPKASGAESPAPSGHKGKVPVAGAGYVVKKGDTLYSIAEKELGNAKYVKTIEALNPGIDPKNLRVGSHLVLPEK